MIRRLFFFLVISHLSFAISVYAKDVDCSCPEITCGPCQKKISIGKEVRFCSWGEINVCRKVICENVNYYFGCISSLKNGKGANKTAKPSISDVQGDEDFALDYEKSGKKGKKKKTKKRKKKVARKKRKEQAPPGVATKLPPKIVSKNQKRGVSSLRVNDAVAVEKPEVVEEKILTADEILRRNEKEEPIDLTPAGRVEAENDSRVLAGEEYSNVIVGKVTGVKGNLRWLHHGEQKPLRKGLDIYVGNEILNQEGAKKRVTLLFPKGEVSLTLYPKSRLIVQDPQSLLGRFQPFVHLVYGGLEADVKMDEGSFDILSGKVLARASSGKLKTVYEMEEKELKVNVESLRGKLVVIRATDLSGPGIEVEAGSYVSWASDSSYISPVMIMSEKKRKALGLIPKPKPAIALKDWKTHHPEYSRHPSGEVRAVVGAAGSEGSRKPASLEESLCRKPQGQFKQCAWSCEGNPKKAKDCQAQKANVHCVRRICNAAGQWGQATPFASAYRDLCPAEGTRVGDCEP